MPRASGQKYHYRDHDTDVVDEIPPVQNTWYEVFHAEDVRLIWCILFQENADTEAKDMEIRWTIDGTVYFVSVNIDNGATWHVWRDDNPSNGGTLGLAARIAEVAAGFNVDKRGLDFKVEVRMTSVPGTNQRLLCRCVRETLELT